MRRWTLSVLVGLTLGAGLMPGCSEPTSETPAPDDAASDGADGADNSGDATDESDSGGSDTSDADGVSDATDGNDAVDSDVLQGEDDTGGPDDGTELPDVAGGDDSGGLDDATELPDGDTLDTDDGNATGVDTPDTFVEDVGPTDLELCIIAEGCDTQTDTGGSVCLATNPEQIFPSTCYGYCYQKTETDCAGDKCYDDLLPVAHQGCKVPCQWEDCDYGDLGQSICVEAPAASFKQYSNPQSACCSDGHYKWDQDVPGVPNIIPGACPDTVACGPNCPPDFSPLCGKTATGTQTYQNSCKIQECGATIECAAPCADEKVCPQCTGTAQSKCEPVCGFDDHTYRNECYAKCLGKTSPQYAGACCDCPPSAPDTLYCSVEGTTHGNICLLTCKQDTPAYPGPCVEGCTVSAGDPPACGYYQNEFTKFPNLQCAYLSGSTCVYEGECVLGTNHCSKTNQEYAPVCAVPPGETQTKTFPNLCNAGCSGAVVSNQGACADCAALCPAGDVGTTPHCGPDCVLYPNDCVATKCAGFDIGQLSKNTCPAACSGP